MERVVFPPEAAFTFNDKRPFLTIETHFDNPSKIKGKVDQSGVRLHFAKVRRKYELGTIELGDAYVSRGQQLVKSGHRYQHTCLSKCTRGFSQDITIFKTVVHMHRMGQEGYMNLYSENGTFIQNLHQVCFATEIFPFWFVPTSLAIFRNYYLLNVPLHELINSIRR